MTSNSRSNPQEGSVYSITMREMLLPTALFSWLVTVNDTGWKPKETLTGQCLQSCRVLTGLLLLSVSIGCRLVRDLVTYRGLDADVDWRWVRYQTCWSEETGSAGQGWGRVPMLSSRFRWSSPSQRQLAPWGGGQRSDTFQKMLTSPWLCWPDCVQLSSGMGFFIAPTIDLQQENGGGWGGVGRKPKRNY